MKQIFLSISISLFLTACGSNEKESIARHKGNEPTRVVNLNCVDVRSAVLKDFQRDSTFFTYSDSCFFVNSVVNRCGAGRKLNLIIFDSCQIHHDRIGELMLDFVVAKSERSQEIFFLALFDIYTLTFSDHKFDGEIIPYNNEHLKFAMNNLIPKGSSSTELVFQRYISNFYMMANEGIDQTYSPFFHHSMTYSELSDKYRNQQNAKAFDSNIGSDSDASLLILENNYFGAIVFKYKFLGDKLVGLDEFIFPKIGRLNQHRSGLSWKDVDSCQ